MKKIAKNILIVLGLVIVLAVGLLYGISVSTKMSYMTDYLFKNISQYNWVDLLGRDPVREALGEALGEDKPLTTDAIYDILKLRAQNLSWEMVSADGAASVAEVEVEYDDGNPILDAYADMLTEYVCEELEAGRITLDDVPNLMNIISDEKNAEMLIKAGTTELEGRLQTTATVSFTKYIAAIYIPNNISDEIYDAVTCGLYGGIAKLPDKIIELLIPRLLDTFFKDLCAFDIEAMENITGYDIQSLLKIEGYPALSDAAVAFIAQRAGDIKYSVGSYDSETGKIIVECSYSDGSGIVENFTASILYYAVTHLFENPIPDDAALAELFAASAEAITDYPRISTTLIFNIDPKNGTFEIPDAIQDVASANLVSKLDSVSDIFDKDKLLENVKQQIKDSIPKDELSEFAQQAKEAAESFFNGETVTIFTDNIHETATEFIESARESVEEIFGSDKLTTENAMQVMQNIFSMVKK